MTGVHPLLIGLVILVDITCTFAWKLGRCAPWVPRNSGRFFTLVLVLDMTLSFHWSTLVWVLFRLLIWNRPKDDDDQRPRRRRRKVEEKKERKRVWLEPATSWGRFA